MIACLDQDLLFAQIFALGEKRQTKHEVRDFQSGALEGDVSAGSARINRGKVMLPSKHCLFPSCRDAGTSKPHTEVP